MIASCLPVLASSFAITSPVQQGLAASAKSGNPWKLKAQATSEMAVDATGKSIAKKKVIVLGGDGFCGWPTSLYLSDQGHDVVVVDNLSRRKIDLDLGCDSLTPIASMEVRSKASQCPTILLVCSSKSLLVCYMYIVHRSVSKPGRKSRERTFPLLTSMLPRNTIY